jgi:hypothetical protein
MGVGVNHMEDGVDYMENGVDYMGDGVNDMYLVANSSFRWVKKYR